MRSPCQEDLSCKHTIAEDLNITFSIPFMYIASNKMACKWYSHAGKCQDTDNYSFSFQCFFFFYYEPHFDSVLEGNNVRPDEVTAVFSLSQAQNLSTAPWLLLLAFFFFFLHNINILAALLWFIKSSSRATQSLGRGPMWVKKGSTRLVNATFVETNLAQSLTLSILEEDGENFLHVGVRITSVG